MKKAGFPSRELARSKLLYRLVKILAGRNWLRISEEALAEIHEMQMLLEAVNPVNPSGNNQPLVLLYHYNTLALCQYMLHDTVTGSLYSQKILYLWKMHPDLIGDNASLFLNAVNTTCYNDLLCNDVPQVEENMRVYRLLVHLYVKEQDAKKHFEVIRFNTELKLLHKKAQYGPLEEMLGERGGEILSVVRPLLPPSEAMPIIGSMGISYFVLEQWDHAESLVSQLSALNQGTDRLDILYFTALFHPMILYEKRQWPAMNHLIKKSLHELRQRGLLRPFEHKFLLFLRRLAKADPLRVTVLIGSFLKILDRFTAEEKRLYFLYFDYYGWLESKRTAVRYQDYKKREAENGSGRLEPIGRSISEGSA